MTQTLSLGPLSLLASQSGPLLTIAIHAPSNTAPVSAALASVAAMAGRLKAITPVYEVAVEWHRVRVPGMQQHDKFVSTEDALWDAIDTALARTASEKETSKS